jgi:hypothetical protein
MPAGNAIVATGKSMAPAMPSKCLQTDTCPGDLMGMAGNVIAAIKNLRQRALLLRCRRMLIWISPEMTGSATSLIASARTHVRRETVMNNKDEQTMEAHGITCATRKVYFYKDFKYDRLDDAVRYAEVDARRIQKTGGNT